jgi:hypothetical protein
MTTLRNLFLFISSFALLISIASCDLTDTGIDENELSDDAIKLEFATVDSAIITLDQSAHGSYAFREKTQLVLESEGEFAAFWELLHHTMSPTPSLPDVDFSEFTVLAVMMGVQPTGGYSILVTDVISDNGKLHVKIDEKAPGSGCTNIQVLTSPYHIVKIPAVSGADFDFVTDRKSVDC